MQKQVVYQTNCLQCASRSFFIQLYSHHAQYIVISSCCPVCVCTIIKLFSFTAQCPPLAPILNGAITYGLDFTPDFDIGTLATHTCDLGFRRVGPLTRVCLISMTWSEEPPVCERK